MRGLRKIKGSLLFYIVATIISFACMPLPFSFAETTTYTYDSMNRLSRADYAAGVSIVYGYDGMGNMTQRVVASTDTTAPNAPVIATPTNGSVINASNVTLSGTAEASSMVKVYDGATLLGGVTANASGAWMYVSPLLGDGGHGFTATATDAAGNTSGASTVVAVTIQTTTPTTTASVVSGTYSSPQSVALSCFDGTGSGCDKIYFTLDGSTPTTTSSVYTGPISISSNTTLKYFATDLSGHSELVKSQTYAFETTPPVTNASPAGGAYSSTRIVTLSCSDGAGSGCGKIYYTTDGSMPTTASSVYSGALTISATATLKYFAVDLAGNIEAVRSQTYFIETTPPVTTASPAEGVYYSMQTIALTCYDGYGSGCDKIYFTTDGTTPTTSSSIYSAPINISSTITLKYFAVDMSGNTEAVKSQVYTIYNISCTWINTAGGNWSTPSNWSCGHAPTANEHAHITMNGTYTITLDADTTINSLNLGASSGTQTLSANGKTLTINTLSNLGSHGAINLANNSDISQAGGIVNNGAINLNSNGIVSGNGTLTNNATISMSNGMVTSPLDNAGTVNITNTANIISGVLTTQNGSLLRLAAACPYSATLTVSSGFTNNGTIELDNSCNANYGATLTVTSGELVNAPGGSINPLVGAGTGTRTVTASINNQGMINVGYPLTINKSSAAHTNSGTIQVNADLTINQTSGAFTNSGTIDIANGATMTVRYGTFNYSAGSALNGTGTLWLRNLTANLASDLYLVTISLSLDTSTVNGAATLTNPAGKTLEMTNGTVNTVFVNGGRVNVYDDNTIGGAFTTLAGSMLHIEGSHACGSYTSRLTMSNGFTNNGTIELTNGCNNIYSATLAVTSGLLVNAPGGSINSVAGSYAVARTLTASLNNQGTVTVSCPLTINKSSATHTNSGTINVNANLTISQTNSSFTNSGTIVIANGVTMSVSHATFNQNAGATLSGAGATLALSSVTLNMQTPIGVSVLSLASSTANLTSDVDLGTINLTLTSSTVNGAVTISNPAGKALDLSNSTVNTALINGGTLNIYNVNNTIGGVLTTLTGSMLHIEGSHDCAPNGSRLTVSNSFTNNGTIELTNGCNNTYPATLVVTSGMLVNAPGGSINSLSGLGSGTHTLTASINNQGTISVDHPLTINKSSATHANSGTVNVNADLSLSQSSGSFSNSGTISVAAGAMLSISNGTFTQYPGSTLSVLGALSLTSLTANLVSDIDLGTMNLSLHTVTLNGAVTIINPAGKSLDLNNSTINTAFVNGGTLNIYKLSNTIGGAFTTLSGSILRIEGNHACNNSSSRLTVSTGFTNNGTVELTNGCNNNYSSTLVVTSGMLVNAPGGSINSLAGAGGSARTLTAAINNQGTIAVDYPLTVNKTSATHTNSGAVNVNANLTVSQSSGSFTNNGTIAIASGKTMGVSYGTFNNASSGIVSGSGTLSFTSATFTQNGTITPGSSLGKLSITGALPQTATSVLNMEIGGTVAGTNYDQVAASGAATLNGTMNVSLVNGFTPNTGDSFSIITYGSKTGTFSSVNLQPMGKVWSAAYNSTSVVLSVGGACPAITLSPVSLSVMTTGTSVNQSITATGGAGSYKYAVTDGAMPSGLSISSTGLLSGTPTVPGTYTFTVTATDANYCAGSVTYSVMVQTPCVAPPAGLVSWWQGEGDANDQMSHNTGSLLNGATFAAGKAGQAFSFDGIDDKMQAGTTGLPTGEGDRTLSMWVKITQPVASDTVFAGYGAPGINDQFYMLGATGSGNALFFSNGTTSLTGPNLQNGRWYHVAVTNSSSLLTLYLDGVVAASGALTLSTPQNSTFLVGYIDADSKLQGVADEVQVFNRALTANEIAGIYNAGSNGLCDTVAPTALWTNPANGATNVLINASIIAAFSEAMNPATMNGSNFTVSGGVTGALSYDSGTKASTFTPSANLAYGTTYTATITTGAKDSAGNALAANYPWNFTTVAGPDSTPPTTVAIPSGGAYESAQIVTLTCNDGIGWGCDKIYYTMDGSTPTTASSVFVAPLPVSSSMTLKFFATDLAGNSGTVATEVYTITGAP